MNKGFSLIEVVLALFFLTVGVAGAYNLIGRTVAFSSKTSNQLVASYLAQEGLEIVRNIRDSNLLAIRKGAEATWLQGLEGCASGCDIDYDNNALDPSLSNADIYFDGSFYTHQALGDKTLFQRSIVVSAQGNDAANIDVKVQWDQKGSPDKVQASMKLYNWHQ